jgi:hypothetical protein
LDTSGLHHFFDIDGILFLGTFYRAGQAQAGVTGVKGKQDMFGLEFLDPTIQLIHRQHGTSPVIGICIGRYDIASFPSAR